MSTEKTEAPTPRRLRRLREKGDVPVSRELNRCAALVGTIASFGWLSSRLPLWFSRALDAFVWSDRAIPSNLAWYLREFQVSIFSVLSVACLAVMLVGSAQTGLLFAPSRLKFDLSRLKPGQAWRSRLSFDVWFQGLFALAVSLAALCIGASAILRVAAGMPEVLRSISRTPTPLASLVLVGHVILRTASGFVALAIVAAGADLLWQRHAFLRRNRMSMQDIKQEYKQSEGDPEHKAMRKQLHRELLASSPLRAIAEASVVVRNPIHVAVVLKYDDEYTDAPVVVASGRGDSAKRLLKAARAHGVPEFTDPPIARALLEIPAGESIPEELFEPVAVIFRWLYATEEHQRYDARDPGRPRE